VIEKFDCADLFYSLGVAHPGALRLHNFPKHLQNLHKDTTGERFDLAAVDILRDRERGVPRYNQFRRLFHKPSVKTFDELCDNKEWAEEIKRSTAATSRRSTCWSASWPSRCPRAWASATPRSACSS
jgi:hypothetical protein